MKDKNHTIISIYAKKHLIKPNTIYDKKKIQQNGNKGNIHEQNKGRI